MALLHQRQRVTYLALQRQFQLDDPMLAALKAERVEAQQLKAAGAGWESALTRGIQRHSAS